MKIPAKLGSTSLVGYIRSTPPPWKTGNYFRFESGMNGGHEFSGFMCVNMTTENFREWIKTSKATDIEVEVYGDPNDRWVKVIDPRIGKDWLITDSQYYHLY